MNPPSEQPSAPEARPSQQTKRRFAWLPDCPQPQIAPDRFSSISPQRIPWRKVLTPIGSGLALGALSLNLFQVLPASAEGSRSLYPSKATGNRASLEWRTSNYANLLTRRTLLKVYVNAGEYILLGSSTIGVSSGSTSGNIQVYAPGRVTGPIGNEIIPASADFSCAAQRTTTGNPNQGRITSRESELAGPDTITNPSNATSGGVVPNGYVPCFYQAPSTGIYSIVFSGAAGTATNDDTAPTGSIDDPDTTNAKQKSSVSIWDVTVRDSLTSTTDRNGRLFADYLALFMGGNNRLMNSQLFIVTNDGFRYRTDLGGIDPNGFIIFANNIGFYDSDGQTPLYHDLVASDNQLTTGIQGGVTLAPPSHLMFFTNTDNKLYQPDDNAIAANFIPTSPTNPEISSFTYQGSAGGIDSYINSGGVFTIETNVDANYQIIISRDNMNFDPTNPNNRSLRGVRSAGKSNIIWDGLANNGTPFPVGTSSSKAAIHSGEYHFPLLDSENSKGGPRYELVNPPTGNCSNMALGVCTSAYYDDRDYRTLSGVNVIVSGTTPPNPRFSTTDNNILTGFNTTGNNRAFGDTNATGFGDTKGLDLWTYFPSATLNQNVNIIDQVLRDLTIFKNHVGNFSVGLNGIYTLRVRNNGSSAIASGETITVTDTLPLGLTFVSGTGSGWTCVASGQDVTCTNTSGLGATSDSTITLTVNVTNSVADKITNTAVVSVINPTTNDTNSTNNTASDPTNIVKTDLTVLKTHTGNFQQGSTGNTYNIAVSNISSIPTTGTVTLTDTLPTGLTATAISGTGWNCTLATLTCTRNDSLAGDSSYPAITLTVSVNGDAPLSFINTATVSGGGDSNSANNVDTDVVAVNPPQLLLVKRITRLIPGDGGADVPYRTYLGS